MNDKTSKHIDTAPQHVTTTVGIQLLWLCLVLFFGWLGWNLIVWPSTTGRPWLRWSVGLVAWIVALGALALLGNTLHQAMFRKTGHTHSNDPQPPIPLEDLRLTMDPTPMFGMPWHLHIKARLSDGHGDAHPWLRVALLCTKQPLNTLQTLPSDRWCAVRCSCARPVARHRVARSAARQNFCCHSNGHPQSPSTGTWRFKTPTRPTIRRPCC